MAFFCWKRPLLGTSCRCGYSRIESSVSVKLIIDFIWLLLMSDCVENVVWTIYEARFKRSDSYSLALNDRRDSIFHCLITERLCTCLESLSPFC